MSGVLFDANVISELVAAQPNARVVAAVAAVDDPYLSAITLHELVYGIERLPQGRRRTELTAFLERTVEEFGERLLPVSEAVASAAARMRAIREKAGRPIHLGDALIAGTAAAHDLEIMTRNVGDFEGVGVAVRNPWA